MVGVTWKGARSRPSVGDISAAQLPALAAAALAERRPSAPVVSFRDKAEYGELFKPLPKPEPIPLLKAVQV
jgi:hypothetical protein